MRRAIRNGSVRYYVPIFTEDEVTEIGRVFLDIYSGGLVEWELHNGSSGTQEDDMVKAIYIELEEQEIYVELPQNFFQTTPNAKFVHISAVTTLCVKENFKLGDFISGSNVNLVINLLPLTS